MRARKVRMVLAAALLAVGGLVAGRLVLPYPAGAIDLDDVPKKQRLWVVFKDFLEREDEGLRRHPPDLDASLTRFRTHRSEFRGFLTTGEGVVDWEKLEGLEQLEKVRRIVEELGWTCEGARGEKLDVLLADVQTALLERAAALEVLRFADPSYGRKIRDPEVALTLTVKIEKASGRQRVKGSLSQLFDARVAELTEALREDY